MPTSLVGRDALLDTVSSGLQRNGRVLIEGAAGIGKTALLRELIAAATRDEVTVLDCGPDESEAALPLAALADLLMPLITDVAALPEPQARAVRAALLLESGFEPVDERALGAAVVSLLELAADGNPRGVLVAIDDAPWLDPPSERALRFALRRLSDRIRVVVTRRHGLGDEVPLDLDARGTLARVGVTPLGVGALHRLLADRFGVSLGRPLIVRLTEESAGNALLAIEFTRALLRLPRLPGSGTDLPVPASIRELVGATLATLPPGSVRAARLASLLSVPTFAQLAAVGVDRLDLEPVEGAGLLGVDDGNRVRFTHPTYAGAVRTGIPASLRRRLHAELAAASTDHDERARHLARSVTEPDDAIAREIADAADRVRARGGPDLAADLLDRAAALALDDDLATSWRLRSLHCRFEGGNHPVAAQRADELVRRLRGDAQAEALLLRAAVAYNLDDLPLAAATGERALAAATPGSALAGRIHAHLASFVDVTEPAYRHAQAAVTLLEPLVAAPTPGTAGGERSAVEPDRDDRALLASALMLVFLGEVRAGRPARHALLDRALALEGGTPSRLAGTVAAIWWKGIDDHERARHRLQTMFDLAEATADEPLQYELMGHLAEADMLAGRLADAASWIDRARDLAAQVGAAAAEVRWLGGTLDVLRGDTGRARMAGEAGLAEATASGDSWLHRISLQLTATVELAEGRAAVAASRYGELAAAADGTGHSEVLSARWEPEWIEACVASNALAAAADVLARLERRHARLPRPWTTLAVARSKVLLASAAGLDTAEPIDELLAARESVPADVIPLDRARCLHVAGMAHRRARRKRAARDALLTAAAEFEHIGAIGFAARAQADAERTGVRPATTSELTVSERRVAELAAAGATNREIADTLFISPKTVEANLARAYRKLAIGRRVELRAALTMSAEGDGLTT